MYIIATEDLEYYIPWSKTKGKNTIQDVAKRGSEGNVPRLFTNELSAKLALGQWLAGPYIDQFDEDWGWYPIKQTDPNRKIEWEGKLAPRKVELNVV